MYKGKYEAKTKAAAPVQTPVKEEVPVSPEESLTAQASLQEFPEAPEAVSDAKASPARRKTRKSKRSKKATIIFYSIYAFVMAALFIGIFIAMGALSDWLENYEASQPDTKAEQTFQQHFADPDWAEIYTLAKLRDTDYESAEAFVSYMENKVGDAQLSYIKTSAGLTGGRKYIVKNGEEKLLTFTLQNAVEDENAIPDWQLDAVEVLLERKEAIYVEVSPEHTVCVNGIPLEEQHVVKTTSTVAEDYLPEGIHGIRTTLYYLDGLLTTPTVTATDANGQEAALLYDATNRTYTLADKAQSQQLPEGVSERMVSAVQAYCRKMINAGGNMSSYFDTDSAIYKTILKNEMWFKGYSSYEFTPETVSAPCVYSDTLVSARVSMTLKVTRSSNGTVKDFDVDTTVFMEKKSGGTWKIVNMVNEDVQKQRTQVRLTFTQDGNVLSSQLTDANVRKFTLPVATAPEGMEFAGWFRQDTDENGNTTLSLVFKPNENNEATLPADYVLEPMTLIARFEPGRP